MLENTKKLGFVIFRSLLDAFSSEFEVSIVGGRKVPVMDIRWEVVEALYDWGESAGDRDVEGDGGFEGGEISEEYWGE